MKDIIDLDLDEMNENTKKKKSQVNTKSKQKETKMKHKNVEKVKNKKRLRDDEFMLVEDDNSLTNKKFAEKIDINEEESEEDANESESESNEEVMIDEDHDDNSDDYSEKADEDLEEKPQKVVNVNIWDEKNKTSLKENEQLDFDNEAYEMLHRSKIEWPCMTIDFLIPENFASPVLNFYGKKDLLSGTADKYPYTSYMVAGSQTSDANGFIYYMKWYNMHQTMYDDDPEKGADSGDEEAEDPYLKFERVKVKGNVNRLKTMKNSYLCGFWSDSPSVEIVDLREMIQDLEMSSEIIKESMEMGITNQPNNFNHKKKKLLSKNITLKSFTRKAEGFALEWAGLTPGVLAAGGQDKKIEIYFPTDENCSDFVLTTSSPNDTLGLLKGHTDAIEDIVWSPNQPHVLASCSCDKSIRFWDLRASKSTPPIVIENSHDSDVNCISWNSYCDFMVASGGEDNAFKVWDLRYIKDGPISNIRWHRGPINCIMWDPHEDSQIVVSSEDDRLSIWDFSVEPDDKKIFDAYNQEIPQQLVFLHQGQENIKDVKFHPYFKNFLVSTAENGINVFKPGFGDESESGDSENDEMEIDEREGEREAVKKVKGIRDKK